MKDEMEQFENCLRQQPLKEIPCDWRTEILAATQAAQSIRPPSSVLHDNWLLMLNSRLATFFWPHPKAWAGLATVWIFILVLNFSTRDKTSQVVEKSAPPSPEMIVELKKQRLMFAELVGSREPVEADRQKLFVPKPRSEYAEALMT